MGRWGWVGAAIVVAAAFLCGTAHAGSSLEYRSRGNRFEGIRALPVSGYTIELLSARAIYQEPAAAGKTPAVYRMRFFLGQPASPYVVVREVDNRYSYWLDKVEPRTPWRPGFDNVFEWPTQDVIGQLTGLGLYDLGVIVRVGNESPSDLETVAPVILYYSVPPGSITGYEFVFKTNVTARLEFSVERSDGTPVRSAPEPRVVRSWSYGTPLRVRWNAAAAEKGEYRLKVQGRVLENNQTFGKEIRFYHQPKVR
jgi:hypothetical protein